jgi:hypothetical protein
MIRSARLVHVVVLAASSLLLAAHGRADTAQSAATHYDEAVRLVEAGRIREGLDEFRAAYGMSPNPAVLYNIGQALADLGRSTEAIDALERYLRDSGDSIPASRRREVKQQLSDLEGKTALVTVEVDSPGAIVRLDDREIGMSPLPRPVRVDAGAHVFSASREGYTPDRQTLKSEGGTVSTIRLAPVRETPASEPSAAPAKLPIEPPLHPVDSSAPSERGSLQRVIGIAVGAVGLVGLGVGSVYALRSRSKDRQSDQHCGSAIGRPEGECEPTGLSLNQQAMDASTVAMVSFVVGGAAVLGGVTLYLTAPSADAPSASSPPLRGRGWLPVPGLAARGHF